MLPREQPHATYSFRFENRWLREAELKPLVLNTWSGNSHLDLDNRLKLCINAMQIWGRELNLRFRRDINITKRRLEQLRPLDDSTSILEYEELRKQMADYLEKQSIYWKQRAKQHWYKDGDLNTNFFHATANGRRKKLSLSKLLNSQGNWAVGDEAMGDVAIDYFRDIFRRGNVNLAPLDGLIPRLVTEDDNVMLLAPFTDDEFHMAISQMSPNKAPGPDGLNPCFYQTFWSELGGTIASDCRDWLAQNHISESVRDTNIILLPKKQSSTSMSDLRPISLCDVRYRLISKVLANRLRQVIPHIIGEEQSAFVHGRSIVDNVLVAAETLHTMNTRRYAKFGEIAVKIDISKAFDRVEWDYLRMILHKLGFGDMWVNWMIMCVTSVRYSVVINSKTVGPVIPERGLRQGCPLSPFLFIICAEGLSFLIRRAVMEGALHDVNVCQRAPRISHLFFADDSFFFCRAQIDEVRTLKGIFNTYAAASSQIINYGKSGIFASKSTHTMLADGVSAILGIMMFESGKTWMTNIICLKRVLEENMLNGYYDDCLVIHVALLLLMNIIYHVGIMIFESGKTLMTNIICLKGVLEENM
ncbi:Transposon TX1 uncharacterized 149 kDa protein [Linum perenne]